MEDADHRAAAPRRRAAAPPPLDSSDSDSDDSILQDTAGLRSVRRRLNESPRAAPAANRRVALGGFINADGTDIRSAFHATALIGVLQLARSAPGGITSSLGHSNVSRVCMCLLYHMLFHKQVYSYT